VRPHEFIPERWYSELELVKIRSVFVPFALGESLLTFLFSSLPPPSYPPISIFFIPTSPPTPPKVLSSLINNNRQCYNTGRHACIGKSLALSELRYVTALLASKYDISFAPDDKDYGRRVEGDMRDRFTAAPGELRVVFRPR